MSLKIAIVGAGQSGLPLALALQGRDDTVTLVTNRSPDELRRGKVMSSQCMFDNALQIERDFGLDLWADDCPPVEGHRPDGAASRAARRAPDRPPASRPSTGMPSSRRARRPRPSSTAGTARSSRC